MGYKSSKWGISQVNGGGGNVTFGVKRVLHYERHSGIGFAGKWGFVM